MVQGMSNDGGDARNAATTSGSGMSIEDQLAEDGLEDRTLLLGSVKRRMS